MPKLSHFRKRGEVAMVDVTAKSVTERTAIAQGFIRMSPAVLRVALTPTKNGVELSSRVTATARTGVEMEALVAVSAAALTVYDMCKALDKGMEITEIALMEKIGGKSGHYKRKAQRKPRSPGRTR